MYLAKLLRLIFVVMLLSVQNKTNSPRFLFHLNTLTKPFSRTREKLCVGSYVTFHFICYVNRNEIKLSIYF